MNKALMLPRVSVEVSLRCKELTLDALPGTYALLFRSVSDVEITVGKLGKLRLEPGFYVYVGSACGPGGIRGRMAHHLGECRRQHWHIDYLKTEVAFASIWYCYETPRQAPSLRFQGTSKNGREHVWAQQMRQMQGAALAMAGFGSSDCTCESHLYFFTGMPSKATFEQSLRRVDGNHPPIFGIRKLSASNGVMCERI
jgi:Uri superfamily endonuclease